MSPNVSRSCCASLIGLALWTATGSAFALSGDRRAPVDLSADRIDLDQRTGITHYIGHVVVTQGSLRIQADRARAVYGAGAVRRITAVGAPAHFREQPKAGAAFIEGEAEKLIYDAQHHEIRLEGEVHIRQGHNLLDSDQATYDLSSGVVTAERVAGGPAVHVVVEPKGTETAP